MPSLMSGRASRASRVAVSISRPRRDVERLERVSRQHAVLDVVRQELALGVVAREGRASIWVRSLVPNEKKSATSAISSARQRRPRHLDHGADQDARGPRRHPPRSPLVRSRSRRSSVAKPTSGIMISARASAAAGRSAAAHDGAHLHLVDLGVQHPQPAAAGAQHRVLLVQRARPARQHAPRRRPSPERRGRAARRPRPDGRPGRAGTRAAADRAAGSSPAGPSIARKMPSKSPCWNGSRRSSCRRRRSSSGAMIISRTTGSRSSPKNMCSVRQRPMPSAPSSRALRGVLRGVGVGPHAEPPDLVGPADQRLEVLVRAAAAPAASRPEHLAGRAVDA